MAAKKKLTTNVVLSHQGDVVTLGPDDDVPDWATSLIGDHCYVDPESDEAKAAESGTRRSPSPSKSA